MCQQRNNITTPLSRPSQPSPQSKPAASIESTLTVPPAAKVHDVGPLHQHDVKSIWETIKHVQQQNKNTQQKLMNLENDNKLLKKQNENDQSELQNIKQNASEISKETEALKQEIKQIKSKLQQMDNDNNNDDEKQNPLDELMDFLSNAKYRVNLPQYYEVFKQEGFEDMDVLKELNDADLVDINIEKKAHRMKILRGLQILNANNDNNSDNENIAAPATHVEGPKVVNTKR